jgi:hypothetical protein
VARIIVVTRIQEVTFGVLQVVKTILVLVKKSVQRKLPDEVAGAAVPEVVEVPEEAVVDLAEAVASEEAVVDLGEAVASEVAIVAMAEATMADGGPIMALA